MSNPQSENALNSDQQAELTASREHVKALLRMIDEQGGIDAMLEESDDAAITYYKLEFTDGEKRDTRTLGELKTALETATAEGRLPSEREVFKDAPTEIEARKTVRTRRG
jgi:hypothetical protein